MNTFLEFLADRDPALLLEIYQSGDLLNEVNPNWYKYIAPFLLGTAAQAGTTEDPRKDYENAMKRPQDANTEKELYKRLFTQGKTLDDITGEVKRSRKDNYERAYKKVNDLDLPTGLRKTTPTEHEENYRPQDIISKKVINPYDYIRSAQYDPQKFDTDFNKLNPENPNDKGFGTFKHKFHGKEVMLYVVKDSAMKKVMPDAEGYQSVTTNPETGEPITAVFMPASAFEKDGNLTKDGKRLLAHELRHATQRGENVPEGRGQTEKSDIDHYMHDPVEMGVRLAAIKNLVSPETFMRITKNDPKHQAGVQEILKKVGGDEKQLFNMIMNPQGPNADTLKFIRERLKLFNADVHTLILFYDRLKSDKKANFMQELLDNYDRVVKGGSVGGHIGL